MRNIYPLHCDAIGLLPGTTFWQNIVGQIGIRHRQHCHRDSLVETARSAAARVKVERPIYVILSIPVAVSADHNVRFHIRGNVFLLMSHEELAAVELYLQGIWNTRRPVSVIIAADDIKVSTQIPNLLKCLRSAYIAAVKDYFTGPYNIRHLRPQQIMSIGNHCNPVTRSMFIAQF